MKLLRAGASHLVIGYLPPVVYAISILIYGIRWVIYIWTIHRTYHMHFERDEHPSKVSLQDHAHVLVRRSCAAFEGLYESHSGMLIGSSFLKIL